MRHKKGTMYTTNRLILLCWAFFESLNLLSTSSTYILDSKGTEIAMSLYKNSNLGRRSLYQNYKHEIKTYICCHLQFIISAFILSLN